ncbi:hypothetical protein [Butyrivibrio proteoclasticus]|uniref:hypothetical protein n=1 Tax=Butyrivibrio proteoclasticus TaxID=43305 RepID=UPI00047D861A|nr:hypothetical protein [Butyrivibrio proteoclasticus]
MGKSIKGLGEFIAAHKKFFGGAFLSLVLCVSAVTIIYAKGVKKEEIVLVEDDIALLPDSWPSSFNTDDYVEPEFVDDGERTNNAFNVADFGEQGQNGWFYRYGSSQDPARSKQLESFDGERYSQIGQTGLEIKAGFIHTAQETSPILEWRAAENGNVNIQLTYVKNVNNDKNPMYPDGVTLYIYKGNEAIGRYTVDAKTDEEVVVEKALSDVHVDELESLYFVVDPNMNNAYDGGSLYVAISDVNASVLGVKRDENRIDNNAYSIDDFGFQGSNGWTYMCGKDVKSAKLVSTEKAGEYMNCTSPSLSISKFFIHPSVNDEAMLCWQPKTDGAVEIRGTYTKFEQNDGNPQWPDGVTVSIYKNGEKLFSQKVNAPDKGENKIAFRGKNISIKTTDRLYFVVDANGNASYDGGCFDISILDRTGVTTEKDVVIEGDAQRDNNADVKYDFGKQGENGWFFQEGFGDDPFDCYNMRSFDEKEYRYMDGSYLEIKNDFVSPGKGKSAVIKWKVAKDGVVNVDASYTKFRNEDKNPSFPDGTRVTLYYNDQVLCQEEFKPDTKNEVTKKMSIESLKVKKGGYITMVVNGKGNNAYDAGKYEFSIFDLTGATTENDVAIDESETRQNFADVKYDFGQQGTNGWFYQEGKGDAPFVAYNMRSYDTVEERYMDKRNLEIKRDFVSPGKGKSAVIKWKVAQTGTIKIDASYTKLKNEDKNPSWPDGTRVTIYHNETILVQEEFAADTTKEITKRLDVSSLDVAQGDYITMVVNGKENNAYDAGKFEFSIKGLSPLTGHTEKDVVSNNGRSNNASAVEDFGKQGSNGFCYQYGYYLDPFFAVNVEKYQEDDKYTTIDGIEIKRDYIMPANKGRSANVKWVVAQDGTIDIMASYTKLKNEDKNPDWPDGVTVYLYKNKEVLRKEEFAPLVDEEVTKDLTVEGLSVKAGDCITLLVDGKENTAYDGGTYQFVIEDADLYTVNMVNNSGVNYANLAHDFGQQGSNGWYYLEGRSINRAEVLTKQTEDGSGYTSRKQKYLEVKKDFVQPRLNADAMYKWVVAADGEIDIEGLYTKFGHNDPNESWPDGVTVSIYKNNSIIYNTTCNCSKGEGNDNVRNISIKKLTVRKGDILTFDIGCNKNNAWDGGRLEIDIADSNGLRVNVGDAVRTNNTVLGNIETMAQGTDGWWFLEGNDLNSASVLVYQNDDKTAFISPSNNGLEMKKDYVHPGEKKSAIYQWVVYEDGNIDILGDYTKFGQNDANPDYPDGVKVSVYLNNEPLKSEDVAVYRGDGNDNKAEFFFTNLEVKRGDIVSFVIDRRSNAAYDAGRLSASIYESRAAGDEDRTNNANLYEDFGQQGFNGWHYGMCDWDGKNYKDLSYDEANNRYYNSGKPELKADFVEPGNGRNAAYTWVAAQTGKIYVKGSYTKFANTNDPYANGVCMRIFVNGEEKKWIGGSTQGQIGSDVEVFFDEAYVVHQGDIIMFAVDPDGNDSYDGGKLSVTISDTEAATQPDEEPEDQNRTNNTNLYDSFGQQGNDGWHYGMCDWDGKNFEKLSYDESANRYYNSGKPELKADFVEPGNGRNAAYTWTVAQDGTINVSGTYIKYANSNDPYANGVCMRIFINGQEKKWIGGVTQGNFESDVEVSFEETYQVSKGDIIMFAVDPDGNDSYDGGKLSVTISDADNASPNREQTSVVPATDEETGEDAIDNGEDDSAQENSAEQSSEDSSEENDAENSEDADTDESAAGNTNADNANEEDSESEKDNSEESTEEKDEDNSESDEE